MTTRTGCEAIQYSDQMQCGRCGLAWDTNDPEPPACAPRRRRAAPPAPRQGHDVRVWVGDKEVKPTTADREYGRRIMADLMEKLR